jgi:Xaa-Pro aminopeptidase
MTATLSSAFFSQNRLRLVKSLAGKLVALGAYAAMQKDNDAPYKFQQEANFWYLTGLSEPNWLVIIDGSSGKDWLVAPELSETKRIFEGNLSNELVFKISGIKNIVSQQEADNLLRQLARKHSLVYTLNEPRSISLHSNFVMNPAPKMLRQKLERIFNNVQSCRLELARLRAIKQPCEIAQIKQAITLTSQAFELIKKKLPGLQYEYEVEAEFTYYFRRHNANYAFEPIVASGKNACTLHYQKNDARLKKNQLLLLDIGARLPSGYAADLTRTYAVGTPTDRQHQLYKAVAYAKQAITNLLEPDILVSEYQNRVVSIMKQAMYSLNLSSVDDEEKFQHYFPHAVSHGLGVDVHDSLGRCEKLLPGMVLTVEPGIYIPEEGLGIRLEDDVLITETGHLNLSKKLSLNL